MSGVERRWMRGEKMKEKKCTEKEKNGTCRGKDFYYVFFLEWVTYKTEDKESVIRAPR